MGRKRTWLDDARSDAALAIKNRVYPDLRNYQWAWGFLRRWQDYIDAYGQYTSAPPRVKAALGAGSGPIPEDISVEWLALDPPPLAERTYGEWRASRTSDVGKEAPSAKRAAAVRVKAGVGRKVQTTMTLPKPIQSLQPERRSGPGAAFKSTLYAEHFGLKRWIAPHTSEDAVLENPFLPPPIEVVCPISFEMSASGALRARRPAVGVQWFYESDSDAVVILDVDSPLDAQWATARKALRKYGAQLRKWRKLHEATHGNTDDRFEVLFALLDLRRLGLTYRDIEDYLPRPRTGRKPSRNYIMDRRKRALKLCTKDYRYLAFAPEQRGKKATGGGRSRKVVADDGTAAIEN